MDLGVSFLVDRQHASGLWLDFRTLAGDGTDWPTGYVASCLASTEAPRECVARARRALVRRQQESGGWGFDVSVPPDADSTAYALLGLGPDVDPKARVRGLAFLAGCQRTDGGFPTYPTPDPIRSYMKLPQDFSLAGWCQPHVEVTAAAGRALVAGGAEYRERAVAAWRWVLARQQEDGAWRSYWWASACYPTLQCALLGVEIAGGEEAGEACRAAAEWILRVQREDGSWGAERPDPWESALALWTLARMPACEARRLRVIERGIPRLEALRELDGGWPGRATMRIPRPDTIEPESVQQWVRNGLGTGVEVRDHRRAYTTATCVAALASATALLRGTRGDA